MSARTKEWCSVLVMLAMTGFFYLLTPDKVEAGGSIFPNVVMGLMAALAVIKIATMLAIRPQDDGEKEPRQAAEGQTKWRFYFVLASMIAYIAAVDYIGFYVSSLLFFFGVTMAIQVEERTPRSIGVRLVVVTGFLLFLWVLFTKVLMAQLPKGILF